MGSHEQQGRYGLIEIDEGWGHGRLAPLLGGLVLILTGLIVVGTGLVDTTMPLEHPKLLGTELEEDQAERAEANLWDGTRARLFERDYDVTSRVRRAASEPYARFLMRYLHETSGSVLMGFEGWLFAADRMDYPTEEPDAGQRRSVEMIRAVERRFASHGVRFVVLPLPRKCVIEADRLPFGVRPQAQLDRGMVEALRAAGLETVDVPAAFASWEGPSLFRAADTHWTIEGMRLAAEQAALETGLLAPLEQRFGELVDASEFQIPEPGDLLNKLGLRVDDDDPRNFDGGATVVKVREGSDQESLKEFRERRREAWLLTGTSYSTTRFIGFVAHYFGRPLFLGGQGAVRTTQALAGALERAPYARDESGVRSLPPFILAEFPGHHLLRPGRTPEYWTYAPGVLELLRMVPARESTVVAEGSSAMNPFVTPGQIQELDRARNVAMIEPGSLVRSGDGTVELVLELEVTEPGAELVLRSGHFTHTEVLPAGRSKHRFPLMGDGETARGVTASVKAKPGAAAVVHRAEVEVNGRNVEGGRLRISPCEELHGGAALKQEFELDRPIELDRYDCLLLDGESCLPLSEGTIQCFLGAEPVGAAWRATDVAQAASWAVNLGGLSGQSIDRVVLEGRIKRPIPGWKGGVPLFEDARLVGLREASSRRGIGPILLPD